MPDYLRVVLGATYRMLRYIEKISDYRIIGNTSYRKIGIIYRIYQTRFSVVRFLFADSCVCTECKLQSIEISNIEKRLGIDCSFVSRCHIELDYRYPPLLYDSSVLL